MHTHIKSIIQKTTLFLLTTQSAEICLGFGGIEDGTKSYKASTLTESAYYEPRQNEQGQEEQPREPHQIQVYCMRMVRGVAEYYPCEIIVDENGNRYLKTYPPSEVD